MTRLKKNPTMNARFRQFAWIYLGYLLAVVLFGAWVRISGSGNGCGSHWPVCNGEVIPQAPSTKTIIEFTHRLTSGLCGFLGLALLIWSRRISRPVFYAAAASFVFLLIEAFIGAVLVKKELVAGDTSSSRALVVALHLANTLLLTASTAAAAWWSNPARRVIFVPHLRPLIAVAILMLILTNMTGAVTALGDTLFPRQPALGAELLAKVRDDLSPTHHFLVRLRILHPIVAMVTAMIAGLIFFRIPSASAIVAYGRIAILAQVAFGFLNIALAAPGWMQIVHLLMAQAVWLFSWLLAAEAFRTQTPVTADLGRLATAATR